MTPVLLTIEKMRVGEESLRAMAGAGLAPLCLPLRELRAVEPDAAGLDAIRAADAVIVTSGFALKVYLAHPRWRDAHSPTLIVLSARMADAARAAGMRNALVPDEENQRGVAKLLATLRDGSRAVRAVHLCGSLSTPHDALPADVTRVTVYENHWDKTCENRACEAIADVTGDGSGIARILVTSPSAYRRLQGIIARIPDRFADRPVYYTLGPSTTAAVEADGGVAVPPGTHTNVLRAAIGRMIGDRTAEPQR